MVRYVILLLWAALLAGCAGAPAVPTASPTLLLTTPPPTFTAVVPTPTAMPLPSTLPAEVPTRTPIRSVALPPIPSPTPNPQGLSLPAAWLVIGDQTIQGTQGGFTYTFETANGLNSVTADAPFESLAEMMVEVDLPAGETAFLVFTSFEVASARMTLLHPDVAAGPPIVANQPLALVTDQPDSDRRVFVVPPRESAEELIMQVVIEFSGEQHQNDYVSYFWRLVP